ncbi:DinB family protein [Pseudonocardia sp. CA-142604]|uniref:DinB family protein n=1 Tax=Pseudonocardia sp. CA-142604 TaxID=3240024 RepID=UPI003D8AB62D
METGSIAATLTTDEYLYFLARAFDGMLEAMDELDEGAINTRPSLPGANSPYAIVHHCVEMSDYWIGHVVAGRPARRDRTAEFSATGSLDDLRRRVADVRRRLLDDLAGADLQGDPKNAPAGDYQGPERPLTCAGVLLHVLEELAQHHGHVQLSRDLLLHGAPR